MQKKLLLKNLCCANCAEKIERNVSQLENVKETYMNFFKKTLMFDLNDSVNEKETMEKIKKIIKGIEPDVIIEEI